ncbi:MAG: hypothetical protein CM1200mP28_02100 [Deltaproteobacteria bacterium]|nr:MAG: hypothetical protein CM1200mP28_02100 [Deltaproteobacteria bacterium]
MTLGKGSYVFLPDKNHYADSGDQNAAERYRAESQRVSAELNKKLS